MAPVTQYIHMKPGLGMNMRILKLFAFSTQPSRYTPIMNRGATTPCNCTTDCHLFSTGLQSATAVFHSRPFFCNSAAVCYVCGSCSVVSLTKTFLPGPVDFVDSTSSDPFLRNYGLKSHAKTLSMARPSTIQRPEVSFRAGGGILLST